VRECRLHSSGSRSEPLAGYYEHGNELQDSTNQLSDNQLLKDLVLWS